MGHICNASPSSWIGGLNTHEEGNRPAGGLLSSLPQTNSTSARQHGKICSIPADWFHPLEGLLHIRILNFFGKLIRTDGTIVREVVERQLAMKGNKSHSWVVMAKSLLSYYNLPSAYQLLENPPSKLEWKHLVRTAVMAWWELIYLKEDAKQKTTLCYLNLNKCNLRAPHPV